MSNFCNSEYPHTLLTYFTRVTWMYYCSYTYLVFIYLPCICHHYPSVVSNWLIILCFVLSVFTLSGGLYTNKVSSTTIDIHVQWKFRFKDRLWTLWHIWGNPDPWHPLGKSSTMNSWNTICMDYENVSEILTLYSPT